MHVITFDIGIKNFAFCYAHVNPDKSITILKWDCVSLVDKDAIVKKKGISELTDALLEFLVEAFSDVDFDYVFVENQPATMNGLMKSMSMVVYTFFKMRAIGQVLFINATNKLKCEKNPGKAPGKLTYNDRKKLAIRMTREYLQERAPDRLEWFNTLKKADDYSDTFLYIIYVVENEIVKT